MTAFSRALLACLTILGVLTMSATHAAAATERLPFSGPEVFGIPLEFLMFAVILLVVAFVHVSTLVTAVTGAVIVTVYKVLFSPFATGSGLEGFAGHVMHEWVILTNLLALIVGFAIMSKHVEDSEVPKALPNVMPDDWRGGLVLLLMVFAMSAVLDNIASAMVGGAIAHSVFRGKVHIGYLAAIVAAANAGGAGSVVGDTTTTMMWIAGASPLDVAPAYFAAIVAFVVFAIPASLQQHRYSPIVKDAPAHLKIDWGRIVVVTIILAVGLAVNIVVNSVYKEYADIFPFLGVAIWIAILVTALYRKPDWHEVPPALKSSAFLLALVLTASMMPVERLPAPSWLTAMGLGFIGSVFDNIPLTALAIKQDGYDWGLLSYAIGFGGSIVWFGSTAGVALSSRFPEARSVVRWVTASWYIPVAYFAGFFAMLFVLGWNPVQLN